MADKWRVVLTKQAQKDAKLMAQAGLKRKAEELLEQLACDPFARSHSFEKLIGELSGLYSRRINLWHRLVYQIYEDEHVVKVIRMWTHYE